MGLDRTAAEIACAAKSLGADFTRTLTIGRQSNYVPRDALKEIAKITGGDPDQVEGSAYSEPFFQMLGADRVDSMDASEYEQATLIHDLNAPLPEELREQFTVVFDGGSLEHVFNVPEALKSCMEMLRPGGFFVQVTNANNFMGHGFWQFSPELLYRVFSPENGFETLAVILQELPLRPSGRVGGKYVFTRDPQRVGARVMLVNSRPTYIATIARKIRTCPLFERAPQQSDYVVHWGEGEGPTDAPRPSLRRRVIDTVRRFVPDELERGIRPRYWYKAFAPLSRADLLRGRLPRLDPPKR